MIIDLNIEIHEETTEQIVESFYNFLYEKKLLKTIGGGAYPWHLAGAGIRREMIEAMEKALKLGFEE